MLHSNLNNVSKLKISGRWEVLITNDGKEELQIDCRDADKKRINQTVTGDTLELEFTEDKGLFSSRSGNAAKAKISIKRLDSLEVSGESFVSFDGFDGEQLALKCTGEFDLNGENSRFNCLQLEKTGSGRIDLKRSKVTNADVLSMGVGDLILNMDGGRLTGRIMGMGNTVLSGMIAENSLVNMGMSSVQYHFNQGN